MYCIACVQSPLCADDRLGGHTVHSDRGRRGLMADPMTNSARDETCRKDSVNKSWTQWRVWMFPSPPRNYGLWSVRGCVWILLTYWSFPCFKSGRDFAQYLLSCRCAFACHEFCFNRLPVDREMEKCSGRDKNLCAFLLQLAFEYLVLVDWWHIACIIILSRLKVHKKTHKYAVNWLHQDQVAWQL